MEFQIAALCDQARVENDGKMSLLGIFGQISCQSFPCVHPSMWLACSVSFGDAEKYDIVDFWVDRIDPDGRHLDRVMSDSRMLVRGINDSSIFNFIIELKNLLFDHPGDYQFSIFENGRLAKGVVLKVRRM